MSVTDMQSPPQATLFELLGRIAPDRQPRRPFEIGSFNAHVPEHAVLIAGQPPHRATGQPVVPQPGEIPALGFFGQRLGA